MNQCYADFAVAYMSFVPVYILLLFEDSESPKSTLKHIVLGLVCCAGAALTKQAALYLVGVYPILCFVKFNASVRSISRLPRLGYAILSYIVLAALVSPWYLFVNDRIKRGVDQSEVPYVTNQIYHGADLGSRCINSLSTITKDITTDILIFAHIVRLRDSVIIPIAVIIGLLVLLYLVCLGIRDTTPRLLVILVVAPYYVIWTLYFSYGIRNLAIILPVLAVAAGFGCTRIKLLQAFSSPK